MSEAQKHIATLEQWLSVRPDDFPSELLRQRNAALRAAIAALSQPVAEAVEVMTGAVPDDLAEFLEWVASQLLLRDTKAGTFAQGVASSLIGRAHILRYVAASSGLRGTGGGHV